MICLSGTRWISAAVTGSLPDRLRPHARGVPSARITVAAARPVAQIAREIERRLLPEHRARLEYCRQNKARHDELQSTRTQLADLLTAELGATVWISEHNGRMHVGGYGDPISAEVDILRGSVRFEIHANPARAPEIARLIARLRT